MLLSHPVQGAADPCNGNQVTLVSPDPSVTYTYQLSSGDLIIQRTYSSTITSCMTAVVCGLEILVGTGNGSYKIWDAVSFPWTTTATTLNSLSCTMTLNTADVAKLGTSWTARITATDSQQVNNKLQDQFFIYIQDNCPTATITTAAAVAASEISYASGVSKTYTFTPAVNSVVGCPVQYELIQKTTGNVLATFVFSTAVPSSPTFTATLTVGGIYDSPGEIVYVRTSAVKLDGAKNGNTANSNEFNVIVTGDNPCLSNTVTFTMPAATETYYVSDTTMTLGAPTITQTVSSCSYTLALSISTKTYGDGAFVVSYPFITSFSASTGVVTVQTDDFINWADTSTTHTLTYTLTVEQKPSPFTTTKTLILKDECSVATQLTAPAVANSDWTLGVANAVTYTSALVLADSLSCPIVYSLVTATTGGSTISQFTVGQTSFSGTLLQSDLDSNIAVGVNTVYLMAVVKTSLNKANAAVDPFFSPSFTVTVIAGSCSTNAMTVTWIDRVDTDYYITEAAKTFVASVTRTEVGCQGFGYGVFIDGVEYDATIDEHLFIDFDLSGFVPPALNALEFRLTVTIETSDFITFTDLTQLLVLKVSDSDHDGWMATTADSWKVTFLDRCSTATFTTDLLNWPSGMIDLTVANSNNEQYRNSLNTFFFTPPAITDDYVCPICYGIKTIQCESEAWETRISWDYSRDAWYWDFAEPTAVCWSQTGNDFEIYAMLLRNKDSTTDIDTCVTKQIDTTTDRFGFQLMYLDCVLDTLLIDTKEFTYYMGSDADKFLIFFRLTKASNPNCQLRYELEVDGEPYVAQNFDYISNFDTTTGQITLDSTDYANRDGTVYSFNVKAYAGGSIDSQSDEFDIKFIDPCRISTLSDQPSCANQEMELWQEQTFVFTQPTLVKETTNTDVCPILCKMLLTYDSNGRAVTKEVGIEPYYVNNQGYDLDITGYIDLDDESYYLKTQTKFQVKCILQNMQKTIDVAQKTSATFTIVLNNPCLIEWGADPFEDQSIDALSVWVTGDADTSDFTDYVDNVSLNYGEKTGLQGLCGARTYKLVSLVDGEYVDLDADFILTLDETAAPDYTISLFTDSVADSTDGEAVDYWLEVSFETYPTVKEHFQVEISVWCNVLELVSDPVDSVAYNVYTPEITFSYNEFVQTPECGHDLAENWAKLVQIVDGAEVEFDFPTHGLTIDPVTREITLQTDYPDNVGVYFIRVYSEVADGEPETTEGAPQDVVGYVEIDLEIKNECLGDVVTMTEATATDFDEQEYVHHIRRSSTDVEVDTAYWTQSVEGCPLEMSIEITSSVLRDDGSGGTTYVVSSTEYSGIVTFTETSDAETGAYFYLETTSDDNYVYDLEVWTISLIKNSYRSEDDQASDPVVFTVELKDACWDATLTEPDISNDSLDIYSDGKVISFTGLIATDTNDDASCGGYTNELLFVDGPTDAFPDEESFLSRWSLSCTGTVCSLTGVTDTFPNLNWEGVFTVQIKGTLGVFVESGGFRGADKQGLYLSKTTTFTIEGLDSCKTTTIIVPGIRDMETSVKAGWRLNNSGNLVSTDAFDSQDFETFPDQSTLDYGVGCGPKSTTMIWPNYKVVSSLFVYMKSLNDDSFNIHLQTTNPDYVGTYEFGIRSYLEDYTNIESVDWFTVTIDPCIPVLREAPDMADEMYQIGENSLLLDYYFSQYPCEYAEAYKVQQRSNWYKTTLSDAPSFVYQDTYVPSLKVISTDPNDAGEYTLVITQTLADELQTFRSFEFNLTVIAPEAEYTQPNNTAPFFTREPADQYIMWGERLYYELGELFDSQDDQVHIEVTCTADFIHFNYEGNIIYIEKNATTSSDTKVQSCEISVWDDNTMFPTEGEATWTVFIHIGSTPQQLPYKTSADYLIEDVDFDSFDGSDKEADENSTNSTLLLEPTFYIYSLRRDGFLTLTISPPIEVVEFSDLNRTVAIRSVSSNLTNDNTTDTGRRLQTVQTERFKTSNGFEELQLKPVIELSIKPSHSEKVDLNFTWKVVSLQSNLIQFQLDFALPPDISIKEEPDMLYVTVWGSDFFKTAEGYKIKPGTTRSAPVTQQVANERLKYIDRSALILDVVIKIVILLSLFIQSMLGKSRQSIWAFVDVLQTLLYIPLLSVTVPAEAEQLCLRLFDTARMMPLPINAIIQAKFQFQDKPYNTDFYDAGYNTTFVWPSLSGILILFATWLVFQCVLILLDKILNKQSPNPTQFQRAGMNCFGRLLLMTYLELMICMSLNFTTMTGMGVRETVSSIFTCVIATVLFFFTVFIFLMVIASLVFPHDYQKVPEFQIQRNAKYFQKHESEQFYEHDQRETFERTPLFWMVQWFNFYDLFDGMKNQVEHHYLMCSGWLLLFVTRRIVFVAIIFALPNWPVGQIFTLFFFSGLVMGYLRYLKPFEDNFTRGQMIFNEWCIFFVTANLLLCSDFVVDYNAKDFVFGYTLIALILFCIAGNLFSIVFCDVRAVYKWRKKNIRVQESNTFNRRTYNPAKFNPDSGSVSSEKGHMKLAIEQIPEVSDHSDSKSSVSVTMQQDDRSAFHDDTQDNVMVPPKNDFLKQYAKTKLSIKHETIEGQFNPTDEPLQFDGKSQSVSELHDLGLKEQMSPLKKDLLRKEYSSSSSGVINPIKVNPYTKNGPHETMYAEYDEDNAISARARELRQSQDLSNLSDRSGIDRRGSNSVFQHTGAMALKAKQANNVFAMIARKSTKHVNSEAAMQGKPYNINLQEDFDNDQPQSRIGSTIRDVPNDYKDDTHKNFNSAGNN